MSFRIKLRMTLLCGVLCLFLMAGCSPGAELPEEYASGDERLPAFQKAPELADEKIEFTRSKQEEENEPFSYTYAGLESGGEAVSSYVSYLEEEEGCSIFNDTGEIQPAPSFSEESGNLMIGKATEDGSGIFALEITWEAASCIIVPIYREDIQIHEGENTVQEPEENTSEENQGDTTSGQDSAELDALAGNVRDYIFVHLGIAEENRKDYEFLSQDGFVMVNDFPGVCVNVYYTPTHTFQASYIISSDGAHIYSLNRQTQEVIELPFK